MRGLTIALVALTLLVAGRDADAAELIMFEKQGCPWCQAFDREVAPIYSKTEEGQRVPLRRVDLNGPIPTDLQFLKVERFTPVFVLVDQGREIGRIRGYPGDNHFWELLAGLMLQVPPTKPISATERAAPGTALR